MRTLDINTSVHGKVSSKAFLYMLALLSLSLPRCCCTGNKRRSTGNGAFLEVTEATLAQHALTHVSKASQLFLGRLLGRCLREGVPARILTWVECSRSAAPQKSTCVNSPLEGPDSYRHMQILSFKTFCRRMSQRFRSAGSELYICFHIIQNALVGGVGVDWYEGRRDIAPLKSLRWNNVFA